MTAFKMTVAPLVEPVLLADAKAQARIDTSVDDALVTDLITGARQWVEQYTGRALITQTWQLWMDLWPAAAELWWDGVREGPITGLDQISSISLPRAPLQSVSSVQYYDNTDASTVWPTSNYYVDTVREPGRLALRMGAVWPVPSRLTNGIMVEYICGYGDDGSSVPETIKTAIRQLVAHWYVHRGEALTVSNSRSFATSSVPLIIEALLEPFRVRNYGI
jgi:hypothetical protein